REDGSVEPVVDAVVWVEGLPFNTTTDAAGFYRLYDVLTGVRRVNAADVPRGEATHVSASIQTGTVQRADLYFEDDFVPAGGLLGTVLDEGGQPVAGARVHLADGYWSTRWHYEVYTDSEGNFRIEDLEPGVYGVHAIDGAKGGIGFGEIRFAGDSDHVTVRFKSGVIRGRAFLTQAGGEVGVRSTVVYRHVEVVPEWDLVSVMPDFRTLITEDDGTFEIPALFGPYEIYVHNAFHGSKRRSGTLDEVTPELEFEFLPNGAIHGVVLGDDGATPVPGVEVTLRGGPFSDYVLTSDADGAFSFELVPPGRYSITAVSNEGVIFRKQRIYARLRGHGTEMDVELVLPKQGTVLGWVEDADGAPVPGAVVTLKERGYPWRKLVHNADDEGIFAFDNIFEGDVTLSARAPSLGNLGGKTCVEVVEEGQEVWGVVGLEGTGEVTGMVTNPETGEPVANARVKILTSDLAQSFVDATNTDGDGIYHFSELKLRDYRIHVFDPTTGRHGKGGWVEVESHGQVVTEDVVLEARGVVEGHLYNPPSNQAVPGRTVRLWSRGLKWFNTYASTDVDGYFEFEGIPEGDFSLYAGVDGRRARGDGGIREEDQRVTVDLYLERLAGLTGRVLGPMRADGSPGDLVENVNVYVQTSGGRVIAATTDNPFELGDILPRRVYSLWGRELNGLHRVREDFRLREGEVRDVDLVMRAVGSVRVEVRTASGTPVSGADVRLTNWYSHGNGRPTDVIGNVYKNHYGNTGDDHAVTFQELRQGRLRAKAEDPITGLKGSKWGILEWDGEEVVLAVELQPSGTVRGQVFLSDGVTPAAGAIVALDAASRDWQLVAADDQGRFDFDAVPLGDYVLIAQEELGLGEFEARGELTADLEVDDHVLVLDDADPRVLDIDPPFGARDLPLSTAITVRFDEPLRRCTSCGDWFKLKNLATGSNIGMGVAWADGDATVVLTPSSLASGTAYRLTITDEVEDLARRNLDERVVSAFYTADVIAPAVIGVDPRAGSVQVATDRSIEVTFSEPVELDSLSGAFQLVELGTGTAKTLTVQPSLDGRRAVLAAVGGMASDEHLELRVTGVRDGSGNTMTGTFVSDFWTVDTTAPSLGWLSPSAGQVFTAGDTIEVTADVSDARGVAEVRFTLGEWTAVVTAAPFTWTVPAPVMETAGEVAITAEAVDVFGNNASAERGIWVEPLDNAAPPTVTAGCPAVADLVAPGVALVVSFVAADDMAVESAWLRVDGEVVDRLTPVDLPSTEVALTWTPPADAAPGRVFSAALEARDFAGNVITVPMTLGVPNGRLLVGDQALDLSGEATFLAAGRFDLASTLSLPSLVLLQGAELVAAEGADLDLASELRVQCDAVATFGGATVGGEGSGDLTVESGAEVTGHGGRGLHLAAGRLVLETGGVLDVHGLGYGRGTQGTGGVGGAPDDVVGAAPQRGGSHGGLPGTGSGQPGQVFDSVYWPMEGGGGGGSTYVTDGFDALGGDGGGVLAIDAAEVVLDGRILAGGDPGRDHKGGAGGTVRIRADVLTGSGTVDATGADAEQSAGGGGRVALWAAQTLTFDAAAQVDVRGGRDTLGPENHAAPGTVFVHRPGATYGDLWIDNGVDGQGAPRTGTETPLPTLGGGAAVSTQAAGADLWLTTGGSRRARWLGAWVRLDDGAGSVLGTFRVLERDGDRLLLEGAAGTTGAVTFQGVYRFDELGLGDGVELLADDPISVTALRLEGDSDLDVDLEVDALEIAGGHLTTLRRPLVAESAVIRSGAVVRGVAGSALRFDVSGTLTVEAGAVLDMDGLGYARGSGSTNYHGVAPVNVVGAGRESGGSHGGVGRRDPNYPEGELFDSVYRPTLGGGGAGSYRAADTHQVTAGGAGGGVIHIEAGELVLDGELRARGDDGAGDFGGAGGTVHVVAARLTGTGTIDARGADAHESGGGGGRVALWVDLLDGFDPKAQVAARGGLDTANTDLYAGPGTIYLHDSGSVDGTLVVDHGFDPALEPIARLDAALPALGSGTPLSVLPQGDDLRLTLGAETPTARWLGVPVELLDAGGAVLGTHGVLTVEGADLVLGGGADLAADVATYRGVYRFDRIELGHGVVLAAGPDA
ncbi:MAG: carboxypeptidase regulatory-like domain-containing protein, partial [Acidobacteriota bacterium]